MMTKTKGRLAFSSFWVLVVLLGGARLMDQFTEDLAVKIWTLGVFSAGMNGVIDPLQASSEALKKADPHGGHWVIQRAIQPNDLKSSEALATIKRADLIKPFQGLLLMVKGLWWLMGSLVLILIWFSPWVLLERVFLRHFGQKGPFFSLAQSNLEGPQQRAMTTSTLLFWHWIGNAVLRDRLSKLVHELKNPISVIRISTGKLRLGKSLRPRSAYLQEIDAQLDRVTFLVQRMLHLSALDHQGRERLLEVFELDALIEEVIASGSLIAEQGNVLVHFDRSVACPLYGEKTLIFAALNNLLMNAVHLTPGGGRVDVAIEVEEDGYTVLIRDEGPGIDAGSKDHLFDRFYTQMGSPSDLEGTGLGLAMVLDVAVLHGGKIRLVNRKVKGAKAIFWLPLKPQLPL